MILVGIDVAKDKHDCFICNSEGEVLFDAFTIPNSMEGFNNLFEKIKSVSDDLSKVKVGLEATGHYSSNSYIAVVSLNLYSGCACRL